jgi:hypothetical protein
MKFDVRGNALWKRQFGPARDFETLAMKTDAQGACYLAGYTPLPFADQSVTGGTDAFVIKFSGQGELLWVR